MKKLIFNSLMIVLVGGSLVSAASHIEDRYVLDGEDHVIQLSSLTEDIAESFFNGKAPQRILQCTKGETLPLHFILKSEWLFLEVNPIPLTTTVLKTCFIKCIEGTFFFSTDLKSWMSFEKFFTGMVGASLSIDEGLLEMGLNVEFNQRT